MAAGYRIMIGGDGAMVGVAVIVTSCLLGLIYRQLQSRKVVKSGFGSDLGFGLSVHIVCSIWFLFLPGDIARVVLSNLALPFILVFTPTTALLGLFLRDIENRLSIEAELKKSHDDFQRIFDSSQISLWEKDFTGVVDALDALRDQGIDDLRHYLGENPAALFEIAGRMKINRVNQATLNLFKAKNEEELRRSFDRLMGPDVEEILAHPPLHFLGVLFCFWPFGFVAIKATG